MTTESISPETERALNSLATSPEFAKTTMTRKQLQAVLMRSHGFMLACGRSWNIVSKRIGARCYRVSLEERT